MGIQNQIAIKKYERLSNRQQQILKLIAIGKSSKEIAADFNLSTKTIESHRNNLILILDIHKASELTLFAIRAGLIKGYTYNEN